MQHIFRIIAKAFSAIVRIMTIVIIFCIAMYSIILPYVFHEQPYVVLSSSMEPTIHVGAVAVVDFRDKDIEEGDIITYRMDNSGVIETGEGEIAEIKKGLLVTHRVVEIDKDGLYLTKGDNNEQRDFSPVYPYQVIGTYKWGVPGLGYVLVKVTETRTRWFVIGIIITLNLAALMFSIAVDDDDDEKKKEKAEDSEDNEAEEEIPDDEPKEAEEIPMEETSADESKAGE